MPALTRRPQKITFGEMRAAGVRGILVYCSDYKCSHSIAVSADPRSITQTRRALEAFRNLKGDLAIRPIFHQDEKRIEAHILIAFLAYCMQITLTRRLHALAPGSLRAARSKGSPPFR
jgi:hypothetical protein